MSYQSTPEGKDPQQCDLARRRTSFKTHLATYIVINLFLWILWYFTGADKNGSGIPWPAWTTGGWGIGLVFHYIGAYVIPKSNAVDNEYEKLMRLKNKQ